MRTVLEMGVQTKGERQHSDTQAGSRPPGPLSQQSRGTAAGAQAVGRRASVPTKQGYSCWVPVQRQFPMTISQAYARHQTLSGDILLYHFCSISNFGPTLSISSSIKYTGTAPHNHLLHVKGFSFEGSPLPATLCDFVRLRRDLGLTPSDLVKWPHVSAASGTACPTAHNTASGISQFG